jgi:hypothetical protein
MLIAGVIPFADARPFLTLETGHLTAPTWPLPEPRRQFIRAVGQVLERRRGGVDPWAGEDTYCDAAGALRLVPPAGPTPIPVSGGTARLACAFRRFFADGRAVSRIEAGFTTRLRRKGKHPLSAEDVLAIVRGVMALPVAIPSSDRPKTVAFAQAGEPLAQFILASTTKRTSPAITIEPWWMHPGEPLFLAEHGAGHVASLRRRSVESAPLAEAGIELAYALVTGPGNQDYGLWLLGLAPNTDRVKLRRLRIHLLRLHAEREALKQLLRLMSQKKLDPSSDEAQSYISDALGILNSPRKYGVEQPQLLEAAYESDELVNPGERASILAAMETARRHVKVIVAETTSKPQPTGRVREVGIRG